MDPDDQSLTPEKDDLEQRRKDMEERWRQLDRDIDNFPRDQARLLWTCFGIIAVAVGVFVGVMSLLDYFEII